MWVEKENLSAVCDAMMDQNFVYVENMTWVQMTPNNTVAGAAARYLRRSHRTMLMFRRDVRKYPEAKEVELRHQRTADVTLDVLQTSSTGRRVVPQHVCTRLWRRSCRRRTRLGTRGGCWSSGRNPARRRDGRAGPS